MLNRLLKYLGSDYRLLKKGGASDLKQLLNTQRKESNQLKLTNGAEAVFFGYHDKIPFSKDGSRILANSVPLIDTKLSNEGTLMNVGYYDLSDDNVNTPIFHKFSETYSWSWQQGCMLQWNPSRSNEEVYFNRLNEEGKRYEAVLFDIEGKNVLNKFDKPIYSLSSTGKYASSLNFSRLARLRKGYGYCNLRDDYENDPAPKDDGVFLIDLKKGENELIVSLEQLAAFTDPNGHHYINHINFSPDENFLTFFHIYSDEHFKKIIRFYLFDIVNRKLKLLEAFRTVSHYCWLSETEIIASELSSAGTRYFKYDIEDGKKIVLPIQNIGDFHPMVNPVNSSEIIVDTKPDQSSKQHLFIVNLADSSYSYIDSFYLPVRYKGPVRCDLHPRWDWEGKRIAVDSVQNGKRCLTILNLNR